MVAHGVLQEVWRHNTSRPYSLQDYTTSRGAPYEVKVRDLNDIDDFDTNNYTYYEQRLTAYLSVCLH